MLIMIKKQYIKPDLFAKEARVIQLIQTTTGVEVPDQGPGDGEGEDFNSSSYRNLPFSQDDNNSIWNTESIWQ